MTDYRTPGIWKERRVTDDIVAIESELSCINGLRAWFTVTTLYEPDEAERGMSDGSVASATDNAAFIVKAVNNHTALVKALEDIQQRANESGNGEMALIDTIHAMHKIAREAITAVSGTSGSGK